MVPEQWQAELVGLGQTDQTGRHSALGRPLRVSTLWAATRVEHFYHRVASTRTGGAMRLTPSGADDVDVEETIPSDSTEHPAGTTPVVPSGVSPLIDGLVGV